MSWDCKALLEEHLIRVARKDFARPILALDLETPKGLYEEIELTASANGSLTTVNKGFDIGRPGYEECMIAGHNFKYDLRCIVEQGHSILPSMYIDTLAGAHLLDENQGLGLKELAPKYLTSYLTSPPGISSLELREWQKGYGKGSLSLERYAALDVIFTRLLALEIWSSFQPPLREEWLRLECPMLLLATEMEVRGIEIDRTMLYDQSIQCERDIQGMENNLKTLAPSGPWDCQRPGCNAGTYTPIRGAPRTCRYCEGTGLNLKFLASAKQLSHLLYDTWKLPVLEETVKGNPSIGEMALKKLLASGVGTGTQRTFIKLLLDYREACKLQQGFYLPYLEGGSDVIHCTFNPWGTVTGRWSCSKPNLQQVPASIRPLFKAREGHKLVSLDLDQAELYLAGLIYEEPLILDAYAKGEDLHTRTASVIYDKKPKDIGPSERSVGKTINFALLYGLSAGSLADRLGCDKRRAKEIMEKTMQGYTGLKEGIRKTKEFAHKNGYVKTVSERVRHLPNIGSRTFKERSRAENQAVNSPIQGSVGYLVKQALLNCKMNMDDAKPLLQVHDELVFEVPEEAHTKYAIELGLQYHVEKDSLGLRSSVRVSDRWGK